MLSVCLCIYCIYIYTFLFVLNVCILCIYIQLLAATTEMIGSVLSPVVLVTVLMMVTSGSGSPHIGDTVVDCQMEAEIAMAESSQVHGSKYKLQHIIYNCYTCNKDHLLINSLCYCSYVANSHCVTYITLELHSLRTYTMPTSIEDIFLQWFCSRTTNVSCLLHSLTLILCNIKMTCEHVTCLCCIKHLKTMALVNAKGLQCIQGHTQEGGFFTLLGTQML